MKHAVITDNCIYGLNGGQVTLSRPLRHASEIHILAERTKLKNFWIVPGTQIADMGWNFLQSMEGYKIFIPGDGPESGNIPTCAVIRRKEQREAGEVHINYPAGAKWAWEVPTYGDCLDTLKYLCGALPGTPITYSPQYVGKEELNALYAPTKRLQAYLAKPTIDLKKLSFRQAAPEVYFTGQDLALVAGMTGHFYDKNSAHPTAAKTMVTGYGNPTHLAQPQDLAIHPGIYRVSYSVNGSKFDGRTLPLIIDKDQEWCTLETVKFAQRHGYAIEIHEAHVFEKSHRIFETWVGKLWQARQRLRNCDLYANEVARLNAYATMKDIMNNSISAMGHHVNWWADMVSGARVARLANMEKWAEKWPHPRPLYAFVDDLAFVSPDSDPETAVPGILARKDDLGGYKHKYSITLTEEMITQCQKFLALPNQQRGASLVHGYFKSIARERGLI
jgi:hypothetical protein